MRAKSGEPLGHYFPEIVRILGAIEAPRFVIDGKLVIELDGRLSFDALQARLHPAESRIHILAAETPARLILFDIPVTPNGTNLIGAPLTERHTALERFVQTWGVPGRLVLSPMGRTGMWPANRCAKRAGGRSMVSSPNASTGFTSRANAR